MNKIKDVIASIIVITVIGSIVFCLILVIIALVLQNPIGTAITILGISTICSIGWIFGWAFERCFGHWNSYYD